MDGGRAGSGSGSASGSSTGTCPFLRRQSVKRSFSTMAETRRSSSPDSLFVSQDHHYNYNHHNHNQNERGARRHSPLALPPPPTTVRRTRYPGDGLDYRRPATIVAGMGGSNVIDLTLEEDNIQSTRMFTPEASSAAVATPEPGSSRTQQRLPNFHSRNIIEVESDAEHEGEERETLRGGQRGGPSEHHTHRRNPDQRHLFTAPQYPLRDNEIMDAASRTAAPSSRRLPRPWETRVHQRSVTPYPMESTAHSNNTIDLTADDDDDVVLTEIRPRIPPQLNMGRPEATAGTGTRGVVDGVLGLGGRTAAVFGMTTGGMLDRVFGNFGGAGAGRAQPIIAHNAAHQQVQLPGGGAMDIDFNYMTVAFQVGGGDPARPLTPPYEAPPKPEHGFTRSPGENEEVVCPNCGDELCMGDDEIKQQVWVIKGCGHAYCGECAHSRTTRKPTKGKGKAKVDVTPSAMLPMKGCQVIGCRGKTGGSGMLRVYVDG